MNPKWGFIDVDALMIEKSNSENDGSILEVFEPA